MLSSGHDDRWGEFCCTVILVWLKLWYRAGMLVAIGKVFYAETLANLFSNMSVLMEKFIWQHDMLFGVKVRLSWPCSAFWWKLDSDLFFVKLLCWTVCRLFIIELHRCGCQSVEFLLLLLLLNLVHSLRCRSVTSSGCLWKNQSCVPFVKNKNATWRSSQVSFLT